PRGRAGVRRGHRRHAVHARRLPGGGGGPGAAAGARRSGRQGRAPRVLPGRPRLGRARPPPGRVRGRRAGAGSGAGGPMSPALGRKVLAALLTPQVLVAALAFVGSLVLFLSTRPPAVPPPSTVDIAAEDDRLVAAD